MFDYCGAMADDITVRARIRRRVRHDEPIPTDERWEQETGPSYEAARDAIDRRVADGEIVLAWYVDR